MFCGLIRSTMENILNKYRNVVASSTDAGPSNSPSATDLQIQMVQVILMVELCFM